MSYLSDLKNRKITAGQFLAKSTSYLKERLGITVSDEAVTVAQTAATQLADDVEKRVVDYINAHAPALPAAIATAAATQVMTLIDAAIAGAANTIKANN